MNIGNGGYGDGENTINGEPGVEFDVLVGDGEDVEL